MNHTSGKVKYFLLGFILFVAILFYYQSLKLPKAGYQLPRLLSGIIVILIFIDLVGAVFHKRSKSLMDAEKETTKIDKKKGFLIFLFLTSSYIFLIQPIGYFIMTPIYLFVTFLLLKSMKLRTNIIVTLGFTIFVYVLFVRFLNLPVPMGFLG